MAGTIQRHPVSPVSALRLFFVAGWRSNLALFRWMRPSAFIPTLIGVPALQLIFFVHLGRYLDTQPVSYYALGNALHACAMAGLFAPAMSLAGERFAGTLPALLATPANRTLMFAGRTVTAVLVGCSSTVVMLILGSVLTDFRLPAEGIVPISAAILVTAASCSAFGLLVGAAGLRTREAILLGNLVLYLMLLVCGINIPRESLPDGLRLIGEIMPMTHGIAAARQAFTGSGPVTGLLLVELGKGLSFLVLAVLTLRFLERGSRRAASLDEV
ncbi:ABC transporter permease [Micromonospora sp. CA-263727]|uniref:ABC transporter permease n=1 Tax=Micromonospora sp. CA-263727 TaxID=3239967 RepID=UPI003D8E976B